MKTDMKSLLVTCLTFMFVACSTPPKEPDVHPAVLDSQYYFIDNGMPIREVKDKQEFFFKKCNVDNRGPYPSKANYDCNEP